MTNKNTIILLSGGLDSLVSLAMLNEEYHIKTALFFNYGQKPLKKELAACKKICQYYGIHLEVIKLDWYEKISESSALNKNSNSKNTASYWMPNRNGLFVNIAAAYADAKNCQYIAIGANKEEANTFSDNSIDFINNANNLFVTSTQNSVKIIAPLINLDKNEIIKKAIKLNTPLNLLWSCYNNNKKHCGKCPSCMFLKTALEKNNKQDIIKQLF